MGHARAHAENRCEGQCLGAGRGVSPAWRLEGSLSFPQEVQLSHSRTLEPPMTLLVLAPAGNINALSTFIHMHVHKAVLSALRSGGGGLRVEPWQGLK
ncbi:unnamed protein product [Boreogadus saida]